MHTLGSTIREIRESKKLSIQDVSKKTNIISRYIEAIENDNFSVLPGEIYVKGFLRNISNALDIDADKVLLLYKNKDIKIDALDNNDLIIEEHIESTPSEETKQQVIAKNKNFDNVLVEKSKKTIQFKNINRKNSKKSSSNSDNIADIKVEIEHSKREQELLLSASSKPKDIKKARRNKKVIIMLFFIMLLIGLGVLLYRIKDNILQFTNIQENTAGTEINIVDSYAKIGVKSGDVVYFRPIGMSATLEFVQVNESVEAILNGLEVSLSRTTPILADINKNGIDDFSLQLISIVDNIAMIEISQIDENQISDNLDENIFNEMNNSLSNVETDMHSDIEIVDGDMYILRNVDHTPILLEATAKRFVYVRYFIDNYKPNTTNLSSGNSISIEAEEVVMLTIGNASEVVLKINGKNISLGNAGQTVNKTIKWIKNLDNSTKFDLIVTDTK